MSISSISGSPSNNSYVSSRNSSNDTSALEAKLNGLKSNLQKEQASFDDSKTKSAKVAEIQSEIQIVEADIKEKKASDAKEASSSSKNTDSNSNKNNANSSKSNEKSDAILDVYA